MIDYDKLTLAFGHLAAQYANYRQSDRRPELSAIDREAIADVGRLHQRLTGAATP